MTDSTPCRLILVGMMGSGKTTLGRALSRRTGWPYHDNDVLLQAATGQTARQLAAAGAAALRSAEADALRYALRLPVPAIVTCAAGVVTDAALRREMVESGRVVWLHAPAEVLAERSAGSRHRPWLDSDAADWLAETARRREPLYRDIASLELRTDGVTPNELAERIAAWLSKGGCDDRFGTSDQTTIRSSIGTRDAGEMEGDR